MPLLFQYLLKFSLSLAVLYTFYFIVLRPLTFYQWNRFYLLSYSLLSFIIPCINITDWLPYNNIGPSNFIHSIPVVENLASQANLPGAVANVADAGVIWNITGLIFLGGTTVMLLRILYQYLSLRVMKNKAVLLNTGDFEFYDVNAPISPFSFANAIFINSRLHTEEEFHRILEHEFVHVKQKHTIDIVLAEIICIFNWFNPFAWLIRKAIRQNLEFIADSNVLKGGIDPRQYQYLLLKVMGLSKYRIANHFSISSLKKRITMMNKMKSARLHLVKFLFVLPLLVVMLLAFRNRYENVQQSLSNTIKSNADIIEIIPYSVLGSDTTPRKPDAPVPPVNASVENLPAPPMPSVNSVPVSTPKKINNVEPVAPIKSNVAHAPAPPLPPADRVPAKVPRKTKIVAPVLPVAPADTSTGTLIRIKNKNGSGTPLYVVDGRVLPKGKDAKGIAPDSIESIDVLKGESAIQLYGESAMYGVVKITTKQGKPAGAAKINVRNIQDDKALIIVDGVETSKENFSLINVDTIISISVLKGDSATDLYKEKGKYGVIIVTTRPSL